jgi:hypothetical protein
MFLIQFGLKVRMSSSREDGEVSMLGWLKRLFTRRPYRTAQPWETPPEIRTKLRCAVAGIDPATVKEPLDDQSDVISKQAALEPQPPNP